MSHNKRWPQSHHTRAFPPNFNMFLVLSFSLLSFSPTPDFLFSRLSFILRPFSLSRSFPLHSVAVATQESLSVTNVIRTGVSEVLKLLDSPPDVPLLVPSTPVSCQGKQHDHGKLHCARCGCSLWASPLRSVDGMANGKGVVEVQKAEKMTSIQCEESKRPETTPHSFTHGADDDIEKRIKWTRRFGTQKNNLLRS